MSIPEKTIYKTTNWHDYYLALKRRGSLTVWFDPAMAWEAAPTGKRGRQPTYSGKADQKTVRGTVFPTNAIQACLTLKVLFAMALRQTTGFVASLLKFVRLDWSVSDFSTLSRRQKTDVWPQSFRPAETPCRGSRPPPEPRPGTRRSGPQHISADHCSGVGPSITDEVE